MQFPQDVIESLISNSNIDHKGKNLYGSCPYCGENEFGISLDDNHLFRCFRGKHCGETGNIFKLLQHLGKTDLLGDKDFYKETDVFSKIDKKSLSLDVDEEEKEELPNISSPVGWRRTEDHPYLISRGFTKDQFDKYEIGTTRILKKFKNYVIFLVRQDHCIKGYVSRNTQDKKVIDSHNDMVKNWNKENPDNKKPIIPRYSNSMDTDFSKIMYGIDEVVKGITTTVIIVEGLFDKINLEIIAPYLFKDKRMIVCCTWGKKMSYEQMSILKEKGIQKAIILYDPDAINDSKRYSIELMNYIPKVEVGFLEENDPGDLKEEEFLDILTKLQDPYQFSLEKLQKKQF